MKDSVTINYVKDGIILVEEGTAFTSDTLDAIKKLENDRLTSNVDYNPSLPVTTPAFPGCKR